MRVRSQLNHHEVMVKKIVSVKVVTKHKRGDITFTINRPRWGHHDTISNTRLHELKEMGRDFCAEYIKHHNLGMIDGAIKRKNTKFVPHYDRMR